MLRAIKDILTLRGLYARRNVWAPDPVAAFWVSLTTAAIEVIYAVLVWRWRISSDGQSIPSDAMAILIALGAIIILLLGAVTVMFLFPPPAKD